MLRVRRRLPANAAKQFRHNHPPRLVKDYLFLAMFFPKLNFVPTVSR